MTEQPVLFHERMEDALAEVVAACGGRKKFACLLWPHKSARDAHNLIDACLNPDRPEKFSLTELLFILQRGREAGCHAAMRFLTQECGYAEPVPVDPLDEQQKLMRDYIKAVSMQEQIAKRLLGDHRLPDALRAVK